MKFVFLLFWLGFLLFLVGVFVVVLLLFSYFCRGFYYKTCIYFAGAKVYMNI